MSARPRAPRIPVPDDAVRTPEEILAGVYVDPAGIVWRTCWNCGGSGAYPSSMIPAGRCRLYCWAGPLDPVLEALGASRPERTGPTRGRLPFRRGGAEAYVRAEQARDRAAYRARVRAEAELAREAETRRARLADPDPRLVALVDAYGVALGSAPDDARRAGYALALVDRWLRGGELSEVDWATVERLRAEELERREREAAEAARRAASRSVGTAGERIELEVRVERILRLEAADFYGRPRPRAGIFLRDPAGNALVWWTTYAPPELAAAAGSETPVRIRGTVKRHSEYRGEIQTELSRVRAGS